MTAPDPLACADNLISGKAPECGESTNAHCSSCKGCPGACFCPPLPAVGAQVMPKPGTKTEGISMPQVPHTVMSTWDHRRDGEPADHVIVVQATSIVQHFEALGIPVEAERGAYLGLDDITVLDDAPRITFTARENS